MRARSFSAPLALGVLLLAIGAPPLSAQVARDTATKPDTAALAYFDRAFEAIRTHALRGDAVDWALVRKEAAARLDGARTPSDTYPALEQVLRRLGEGQGALLTPERAAELRAGNARAIPEDPERVGRLMPARVGLIIPPPFTPATPADATRLATLLRDRIADVADGACGWMIDLRGTTGGDAWPMLAGLGPLLGEGIVGFSTDGEGRTIPWHYANGMMARGDSVVTAVFPPFDLSWSPPVAVLTGPRTRGAGEAVLTAFRGRPNTRSFGETTAGLPRMTELIPLSDGAALSLETAAVADRSGHPYDGAIAPDVTMSGTGDPLNTQPFIAATVWLNSQPECRARR